MRRGTGTRGGAWESTRALLMLYAHIKCAKEQEGEAVEAIMHGTALLFQRCHLYCFCFILLMFTVSKHLY